MLEVRGITVAYDSLVAIRDVTLTIHEGEAVAVIGANGAGKTTLLRTISGLLKPRSGSIHFKGKRIDGLPAYAVAKAGIAHVPEQRRIFSQMTVEENLEMGAAPVRQAIGDKAVKERIKVITQQFPALSPRLAHLGGTLSGGQQQMLAIARGLMAGPEILLMDEPSLGLAPVIVDDLYGIIREISGSGVAVLLVEQNVQLAFSVTSRVYVFETGRLAMEGRADDLRQDPRIQDAFLGARMSTVERQSRPR